VSSFRVWALFWAQEVVLTQRERDVQTVCLLVAGFVLAWALSHLF
jgi:hypothetical protein